jgi:hypothetical protein
VRILLVGALSWNPERIRTLCERGHRLWGLWSRSMGWDQGPYQATDGCVQPVTLDDAARTIREQKIDCVYSLFQVYHPRLWGPARAGVEHDVWTLLRTLLLARARGEFDAPIVRHWGFDVQNIDPEIARAFDGQIFCNREKLAYWTAPLRQGGCGIDLLSECDVVDFLDSDRPKLEFMSDDRPERLSERTGEIHTVCIGRPFGIDYLAAARRGIHVHMYGNRFDDLYRMMARDLSLAGARREVGLLRRFLHVHPSLQTRDAPWDDVRRTKSTWVREFARYDAGWSYIGSPLPWEPLDDRGAIPNRVSTYLLAGLPVITDARPGFYRYDELARLGVGIDLVHSDYDALRSALDDEVRSGVRRANALRERAGYSFDATVDPLLDVLEQARARYFARPHAKRKRFAAHNRRLIHFSTSPDPRAQVRGLLRRLVPPSDAPGAPPDGKLDAVVRALGEQVRRQTVGWKAKLLARRLRPVLEEGAEQSGPARPR